MGRFKEFRIHAETYRDSSNHLRDNRFRNDFLIKYDEDLVDPENETLRQDIEKYLGTNNFIITMISDKVDYCQLFRYLDKEEATDFYDVVISINYPERYNYDAFRRIVEFTMQEIPVKYAEDYDTHKGKFDDCVNAYYNAGEIFYEIVEISESEKEKSEYAFVGESERWN